MKYTYTFYDWDERQIPENAPPESLLDTFPQPLRYRVYRPAWGKGGKSAEKSVATRNKNIHAKNEELFTREVLPELLMLLDSKSLFSIGRALKNKPCLNLSGYHPYTLGEKCSWLHFSDPLVSDALAMGATRQDIVTCDDWL